MKQFWTFGNTTVRSGLRLRDGLVALSKNSQMQGNIRKGEGDKKFRQLLGAAGVVGLGTDVSYSVGRKWRSAMGKLGFILPMHSQGKEQPEIQALLGPIDFITPNGQRLIRSETLPAIQECFLRALAAEYIVFNDVEGENPIVFPALRHVLNVLLEMERLTGEASVSFLEFSVFVQIFDPDDSIASVVQNILALRKKRESEANKRHFDNQTYSRLAKELGKKSGTIRDYGDTNIRYLKATGLVQGKGRGIVIVSEKHLLASLIAAQEEVPMSELERLRNICNGAVLPTDSQDNAKMVFEDLQTVARLLGITWSPANRPTDTPENIAVLRHELEELIFQKKEENFATDQINQWPEIVEYLYMINNNKSTYSSNIKNKKDRKEYSIPKSETPAYLEWVIWRAFLAIDSMINKPWEARRF